LRERVCNDAIWVQSVMSNKNEQNDLYIYEKKYSSNLPELIYNVFKKDNNKKNSKRTV